MHGIKRQINRIKRNFSLYVVCDKGFSTSQSCFAVQLPSQGAKLSIAYFSPVRGSGKAGGLSKKLSDYFIELFVQIF
jgi:hypothetical protein